MKYFLLFILVSILPIISFAAADLQLQSLRADIESDGKSLTLQINVMNAGPNDANQIGCNIYLYAQEKLITSQNSSFAALSAHSSRKEMIAIDLPPHPISSVKVEVFDGQEADLQPS